MDVIVAISDKLFNEEMKCQTFTYIQHSVCVLLDKLAQSLIYLRHTLHILMAPTEFTP